jgi:hypothetical protein
VRRPRGTVILIVLVTLFSIVACEPTRLAASPARPRARPDLPAYRLTEADSGRTIIVHRGDTIAVTLRQLLAYRPWSAPSSGDSKVLTLIANPVAGPTPGLTEGSFEAIATGIAQLHAVSLFSCSTGQACPNLAQAWIIEVRIS